jgi:3-oxoacyl-[acyl-carrier-protein] synthase III
MMWRGGRLPRPRVSSFGSGSHDRCSEAMVICGFGNSRGIEKPIGEIKGTDREVLLSLERDGFESFVENDASICDMAYEAARAAVDISEIAISDVDAVIIATESFIDAGDIRDKSGREHVATRNGLINVALNRLKLKNAQVYGSWMSGCGNLGPTMTLARGLLLSRSSHCILVLAADRVGLHRSRLPPDRSFIFSDVACACVARSTGLGLKVVNVVTHTSTRLFNARVERDVLHIIRELRTAIRELDQKILKTAGLWLRDFDFVVTDSFGDRLLDAICTVAALERGRVLCPARKRYAHAFSADLLLSLGMLREVCSSERPLTIAAISVSSWILSAVICQSY